MCPRSTPTSSATGRRRPAVVEWRIQVAGTDGVLIASPEYAHSLPGSLKNALDWLVGSGELYERPVAVLCGSPRPNGGEKGRAALEQTLQAQGAVVVVSSTVAVAGADRGAEELRGPAAVDVILRALEALTGRSG